MKGKKRMVFCALLAAAVLAAAGTFAFLNFWMKEEAVIARQLRLGQRYLLEENYEGAKVAFQKVLNLEPRQMEAYLGLAQAYTGEGEEEQGLLVLKEAWQTIGQSYHPEDPAFQETAALLRYLAEQYEELGQTEEAEWARELLNAVRKEDRELVKEISDREPGSLPPDRDDQDKEESDNRDEEESRQTRESVPDAMQYLENMNVLPAVLQMEVTEQTNYDGDTYLYSERDRLSYGYFNSTGDFGFTNTGSAEVSVSGIIVGDTVEAAEQLLASQSWYQYTVSQDMGNETDYQYDTYYTKRNGSYYQLDIGYLPQERIVRYWYFGNTVNDQAREFYMQSSGEETY